MEFTPFDNKKFEEKRQAYAQEAQARWGGTAAWRENQAKTKGYGKETWEKIRAEETAVFTAFAARRQLAPAHPEVQALVVTTASGGNPRRTSNGFDYNRAAMLLAVLEKRGGLKVSACDAYLNIIGGLWLDEPAADLAAVVALASSYLDRPVPGDLVAIGEVGLTGELRTVSQLPLRIREAQRLGFRRCVIPAHRALDARAFGDMELLAVRNIGEAIRAALRPRE